MTVKDAIVQVVADLTNAKVPADHEIAGFVAAIVTMPRGGGKAEIVVQFTIHQSIDHHKSDMLRDVAHAIHMESDEFAPSKEVH